MNQQEKSLLHGLYYHREIVGDELPYDPAEIAWVLQQRIPRTRKWLADGKLQSIQGTGDDYLARLAAVDTASRRPLKYLHSRGLIHCRTDGGGLRITVTGDGADLARELDTWFGRLNFLYREHKEGLVNLLLTVAVSVVTALLTALLVDSG
jgi:hypothetical protein